MASAVRYAIGDLARLGGVSRRTVRYYVQESLIPAPLGIGRGNHYGPEHLDRLLRVKALQEAGRTLDEIRQMTRGTGATARAQLQSSSRQVAVDRSLWRRLTLARGVELHVASGVRLPSAARLQELEAWCRTHLGAGTREEGEEDDA